MTQRQIVVSNACARWATLCACVLVTVFLMGNAFAEPHLMTDSELDAVSARGTADEEGTPALLDLGTILGWANPEGNGALFSFNLNDLYGNGSVDFGNLSAGPSTLTLNGNLYTQVLVVEHLIFGFNICQGCDGTVYQTNLGIPIDNINLPPVTP